MAKGALRKTTNKPLNEKLLATEKEILDMFGGRLPQNYHVCESATDLGKIARKISQYGHMAWDTETGGLHPWKDELYCVSIHVKDESFLVNFAHEQLPVVSKDTFKSTLGSYFSDKSVKRIGFAQKFDSHFIEAQLGIPVGYLYYDSYAASWFLDENLNSNDRRLKPLCEKWLGEKTLGTYTQAFGNLAWTLIPGKLAAYYAIKDAELHYKLARYCEGELRKLPKLHKLFHTVEMPCYNVLYETERDGLLLDEEKLVSMDKMLEEKIVSLKAKMNEMLTKAGITPPENWSSPAQAAEIFFGPLKLKPLKQTAGGKPALDKPTYDALLPYHPVVPLYADMKNYEKQQGTFIRGIQEAMIDGRLHPSFKVTGAETGRMSSGDPFNMQNVPAKGDRGGEIRSVFVAPDDYYMVSMDFSGQELRIQACLSDDPALRNSALSGTYYSEIAAIAFGGVHTDYTKHGEMGAKRDRAKAGVLSRNFGARAKKIAATMGISYQAAEDFERGCIEKYNVYENWTEKEKAKSHVEPLENFDGKLRRLDYSRCVKEDGITPEQYKIWAVERSAISFKVQGSASAQAKRAYLLCYRHFKKRGYKSQVKFPIHDEIIFWIHKDEYWNTLILQEIDYIMKYCCPELEIDFTTTTETYRAWSKVLKPLDIAKELGYDWVQEEISSA